MLKPLIKSIPSRVVNILGIEYQVYTPISIPYSLIGEKSSKVSSSISLSYNRNLHEWKVTWPNARRHYVSKHALVEEILKEASDIIESIYFGPIEPYTNTDEKYNVYRIRDGRLFLGYSYFDNECGMRKQKSVALGREESITQDTIKKVAAIAMAHRLSCAIARNNAIDERRRNYRLKVEAELAERDLAYLKSRQP